MGTDSIAWDGRNYPYVPPSELAIHPDLRLHEQAEREIDPITYEVVRHAMWNVNVEHGNTIMKISGSPICAYGHDFNPCLLDETGDFVFFGPFLQYLSSATSSAVKWTLENRSENPGIESGDIFLTNDPWLGATHQSDVSLIAPIFWEGELFCWVGNTLHQWDLGGTSPGGFSPTAPDVFWEAGCIPPIKIVEQGHLRRDLQEEYIRRSRMPELVALDLRAEIAGCNVARERLLKLLERYGAATVKGVMRKLQDDSEKAFVERLRTIPDGTWREVGWLEMADPDDPHVYRNCLTLHKRGDELIFSNEGTDPQTGALNCTLVGWRGAIAAMISAQMLFDQMFVIEGAYRHMDFDVTPGTLTCATYPAAVSAAPALTLLQTIALAGMVISKMLACSSDARLRSEVQGCMGAAMFPVAAISGTDQHGGAYSSILLDGVGAALAGLSWRDGVDTGGWPWDLQSTMPNVEEQEAIYPLLYLWRRELADSGGREPSGAATRRSLHGFPTKPMASRCSSQPATSRCRRRASSGDILQPPQVTRSNAMHGFARRWRPMARCRRAGRRLPGRPSISPPKPLMSRTPPTTFSSCPGPAPVDMATRSNATRSWCGPTSTTQRSAKRGLGKPTPLRSPRLARLISRRPNACETREGRSALRPGPAARSRACRLTPDRR